MASLGSTSSTSFAVAAPNNETTQHYDKNVKPAILAAFQKDPGLPWVSFTLLLRDGTPIVHVATINKSYDGWIEFQKTIAEISSRSPDPLMIEVVEEKIEELLQTFPWKPFALGRSIGVEKLKGSGTMGGYVTLTDNDGEQRIYGLTNNHVVNVSKATNTQNPDPRFIYEGNNVYLPSFDDLEESRKTTNNKGLQNMSIGKLKYASGRTMTSGTNPTILDWALVSVSNSVFKKDREEYKKDYKVNWEPLLKQAFPNLGGLVSTSGPVSASMRVAKYGRTTSVTRGLVSAAKETINMAAIAEWKGGEFHNPDGVASVDEWVAYLPIGGRDFCLPGDSGSWVVDETGTLVGLLWGKVNDRVLVTDITVVFASIKAQTGMQVGVFVPA